MLEDNLFFVNLENSQDPFQINNYHNHLLSFADYLYGGNGRDELFGRKGDDYLYGGNGRDRLFGGKGDDYLYGGNGRDRLIGGTGGDYLYGGNGRDIPLVEKEWPMD